MSGQRLLDAKLDGGRLELVASGSWTARHAAELEADIGLAETLAAAAADVRLDLHGVRAIDTFGAWLVERLARAAPAGGRPVAVAGLREEFGALVEGVRGVNLPDPPQVRTSRANVLDRAEKYLTAQLSAFLPFLQTLGALGEAALHALLNPRTFRLTSTIHQLDRVAWQATPIILLVTFLIGCIIAQQGFFHFRRFGAESYVVDMVGILVTREIGVLLVAIMVAGRSGSSFTAELGSMKMREEIDALRTMGLDPVGVLLLPRVLALVIAVPVLTFLGILSALFGGGLVAWAYEGMSPEIYMARLKDAITLTHFNVGMIKAPFMALIVGVVACAEGLQVRGSAESLGRQTTMSVVRAIFLVIVADGLFAIFFSSIGM